MQGKQNNKNVDDVMKKCKVKNDNKGITLIALVLTIIVLLILAGITIATLIGNNGLLTKTNEAKIATEVAEEKEQIALAYNGIILNSKGEGVTVDSLREQFKTNGVSATVEEADGIIKVTFDTTSNNYWIDANGNIENKEPFTPKQLIVGNYVNYPDKNGNKILCKVLYNNENYGVQLVAVNPVDTVTLGYDDPKIPTSMASESNFQKAKYSYNNAIKTLNDKAEEYRNPKYTNEGGARCIGSVPDNPYSEANDYFYSSYDYMSDYNGTLKNEDTNDDQDIKQLKTIDSIVITDISKSDKYWLSSRDVGVYAFGNYFYIRMVTSSGDYYSDASCRVKSDGSALGSNSVLGFRPVFTLKSNVKIDNSNGKDGTSENPYEIR